MLLALQHISFRRRVSKTLFLLLLSLCPAPARAQKAAKPDESLPKYDSQTEIKTKGAIDEVKLLSLAPKKDIVEIIVKSGSDTLEVLLCPKAFQEDMGVAFAKGDEVALIGSKVKREGSDVVLGREVTKGNDTLVLRDDKGNPVWTWSGK